MIYTSILVEVVSVHRLTLTDEVTTVSITLNTINCQSLLCIWQIAYVVVVVSDIHIGTPDEVSCTDDVTVQGQLKTIVDHITHVVIVTGVTE